MNNTETYQYLLQEQKNYFFEHNLKAPHTSKLIKRMIDNLFNEKEIAVIEGGVETAISLLELPFNHIFFTGDHNRGKDVMKAASKHLSSVTLELGGTNPVIIDKSADLKDAAEKIVWGKFMNAGQSCMAPNHILIAE